MRIAILAVAALAMAGCTASVDGVGYVSIYVKDLPTEDFDEIHVVFQKVEVHGAGNGTSWMTVYENATGQDIDLLNASGSQAAFLGEANLTSGKYTQIRIHTSEAYGIQDGEMVPIVLSNGVLKVVKSFNVTAGQETRLVLDFDLDRAIKETGQGWRMTPIIGKTFVQTVTDEESGADVHEEGEIVELNGIE